MSTARELMTDDVKSVHPVATVAECAALMRDHRVGALPVVDDQGHLMGIVTDRDLVVNVLANGGDASSTIETYGVREVFSVGPDATVDEVEAIMGGHQIRRLPVVEDEVLVGMISLADVAKAEQNELVGALDKAICG
jgi:CBS domain-containing protein